MHTVRVLAWLMISGVLCLCANARAGEAPPCATCRNAGHVSCTDCLGKGVSSRVPMPCPDCKGEKSAPCTKCDDKGMMECPQKKTRTSGGRHMMINPAWENFMKQKSKPFGFHDTTRKKDDNEPEQWIVCSRCQGAGKVKCTFCNGTKKAKCTKCDGQGTVLATGPCPTCRGTGRAACSGCAVLPEGAPKAFGEKIAQLDTLLQTKVVTPEMYWERRRVLVREAADAMAELRQREREEDRKRDIIDTKEKGRDDMAAEMAARRKTLELMQSALASGAIPMSSYLARRDTFGLSEAYVRKTERDRMKKEPALRSLIELEDRFQNDQLTHDQYVTELEKLRSQ